MIGSIIPQTMLTNSDFSDNSMNNAFTLPANEKRCSLPTEMQRPSKVTKTFAFPRSSDVVTPAWEAGRKRKHSFF